MEARGAAVIRLLVDAFPREILDPPLDLRLSLVVTLVVRQMQFLNSCSIKMQHGLKLPTVLIFDRKIVVKTVDRCDFGALDENQYVLPSGTLELKVS